MRILQTKLVKIHSIEILGCKPCAQLEVFNVFNILVDQVSKSNNIFRFYSKWIKMQNKNVYFQHDKTWAHLQSDEITWQYSVLLFWSA